jgi:predicted small lipoprotein YifL
VQHACKPAALTRWLPLVRQLVRQSAELRVRFGAMRRALVLLVTAAVVTGALVACGDSGPSGPDAKAVEEFEDLGLSQEEAEAEVQAADREAAKQSRKEEARFQRELREEEEHSAEQKPKISKKPKKTAAQAAGFSGKYEEAYEVALFACGNYPLERIAKEFHLSPSAGELEVAEAYADGYYGQFEQAAFEGCIEGISKR